MNAAEQLLLGFGHEAASGVADFMPAESNRAALAWLARWPDWPAPTLVLYGPPGCGKSHLAQIWAARTGALGLEPAALPDEAPQAAVLDPAAPVADELALLRLYNRLAERGGHLLLTARCPVAAWGLRLPDLASRLRASPAAAIEPPDDALLAALLLKLFDDRQLAVSDGVIGYLLRHMERSFAAARALVETLDRARCASAAASPWRWRARRSRPRPTNNLREENHGSRHRRQEGARLRREQGPRPRLRAGARAERRRVTITARTASTLEQAAREIAAATGAKVTPVAGDITTPEGRAPRSPPAPPPTSWSTTPAARRPATSANGTRTTGWPPATPT